MRQSEAIVRTCNNTTAENTPISEHQHPNFAPLTHVSPI
jgi:hypothetical protein